MLKYRILIPLFFSIACSSKKLIVKQDVSIESRPNVILIIADDMGLDATPGYEIGSIKPKMPNLQALQKMGLAFTNFSTNPLCSPTRASIISGKYGYKTGVLTVDDILSNSEIILQKFINQNTQNSYATAVIGKWHLAGTSTTFNPESLGIDYYAGILSGGLPSYSNWTLREDGNSTPQTAYSTEKLTDLAKTWVSQQSKPFFLWLAYNAPHSPFHVPPANMHKQGNLSSNTADINANPLPYYLASIEAMDYQIGQLLASLTTEQKANTVIIFIGDNGTPNQVAQTYSRNRVKSTVYQGGINTSLIVSGKGVERTGSDNSLLNSTDLFATIATICGVSTESYSDSKNFSSLFKASKTIREYAYSEVKDGSIDEYAIRNLKNKLIIKTNGSQEFYDLEKDPLETSNLNEKLSNEEKTTKNQFLEELKKIRTK
jgi:arylsulfatase A-like enzyme